MEREKERANELEGEKRRAEADGKGGKKRRRKVEVEMPSVDFFTEFDADEHREPFRGDLPAVDVSGVEDDYGRVRAVMEHFLDEVIPGVWLSWLWFRRYILSYPVRCDRRCVGCHRPVDEPLVIGGHNWRVTKAELPLVLRDLNATDPSWKLFSAHVDCFRYILLDNRNVKCLVVSIKLDGVRDVFHHAVNCAIAGLGFYIISDFRSIPVVFVHQ